MDVPGIPAPLPDVLQQVAREQRLALVGGAVRDLLLHRVHNDPWRGVPDLDLVAEGRAIDLVRRLEPALPAGALRAVQQHGAYGTVEVELVIAGEPVLLDVASARAETYPQPGENPVVSLGALADDLARRDFSINAMALDLASGALLDPHGGQADLQRRQLRLLHAGSLRDDPTRLVRGARYAARLGFGLEPASAEQARATLASWPWYRRPWAPACAWSWSCCWSANPGGGPWRCCSSGAPWCCWIRACKLIPTGGGACGGPSAGAFRRWPPWWPAPPTLSPWPSGCSCPIASTGCWPSCWSCAAAWLRGPSPPAPLPELLTGVPCWRRRGWRRRRWPWRSAAGWGRGGRCCAGCCAGAASRLPTAPQT
ncbi:MAG: hypothetical protein ACO3EF_10665 [Vulcanococcus sp.]